jgi:hypothetical protein
MIRILFAAAVLIGSFWLTAPAFGQCANGVCRRPAAKALVAPARVAAAVPRVVARATVPVVGAAVRVPVAAVRATAKVASAPVKAMRHVACNCQERRCERRNQRGPIFPRFRTRRCF